MARVVVDVMPKPEILDPQGKAVTGALARLGFAGISVRQGKRFELDVDGELTEDRLRRVEELPEAPDEEAQGAPAEQAELATQAG